ncbi:GNAT family N-acetyltransferase [Halobacillus sp. B29]|uniref:GNAT family N-acetyltransferase n=1 Tax=Halobacillus sp. B29 TaxID=3457432 RepID=UPI003FCCE879
MNLFKISPAKLHVADSILRLQFLSYQVEAAIVGFPDLPPCEDNVTSIMESGETFIGAYIGTDLVGAISYKIEDNYIDIYRLMVHPEHFRKGIGQSLLRNVIGTYPSKPSYVYTGSENTPAINLYTSHGFHPTHEKEVTPGMFLTRLERSTSEAN